MGQTIEVTATGAGIGTASPQAKLDIVGSGTTPLLRLAHSGSGATLLFEGITSISARLGVDTNVFRVTGFGNTALYADTYTASIGVGTASPFGRFEVVGPYVDFSGGLGKR